MKHMLNSINRYYHFNQSDPEYKKFSSKVVELGPDIFVTKFLRGCQELESQIFKFMAETMVYSFMTPIITRTGVHALLDRGKMFVLSPLQTKMLLPERPFEDIIDLGAGDGAVSERLALALDKSHNKVSVTEVNRQMIYRLSKRGFTIADAETWYLNKNFDLISMLNLLDRCESPISMLDQSRSTMRDENSRLLIASVFPFRRLLNGGAAENQIK